MDYRSIALVADRGAPNVTPARAAQLAALKATFPLRIVFAADRPDGSGYQYGAVPSLKRPTALAREGYRVSVSSNR